MMPSILRHAIILSARSSSSSGRATLRLNNCHYSAAAAVSTSSSSNNSGASSAAGIQTYSNRQRIYTPPPYRSYYASGSSRSMVTVTQTSASEKSTPPHALNNNNSSTATSSSSPETSLSNVEDNGGLIITSSCASRIRQLASSRPNPEQIYLRLYVDAGGCSGFQYKFLLLSEDNSHNDDNEGEEDGTIDPEEDIIFTKDGMRVVVDQTSLDLLRGSTIDYVQEMIRSSFAVVGNPQSESACGCGSSFAVKNFEANPALD